MMAPWLQASVMRQSDGWECVAEQSYPLLGGRKQGKVKALQSHAPSNILPPSSHYLLEFLPCHKSPSTIDYQWTGLWIRPADFSNIPEDSHQSFVMLGNKLSTGEIWHGHNNT